ncbi:MAG: hypothetical protein AABZ39_16910 [Spirochaetota bacterium]
MAYCAALACALTMSMASLSAYDAAQFTARLAAYDLSSDYSSAFEIIAERIAADGAYDGYADTRRFITGDVQARTAVSIFDRYIRAAERTSTDTAIRDNVRRYYRVLFSVLTDAAQFTGACSAAELFAKSTSFDEGVIVQRIGTFFGNGRYDEYLRLYSLLVSEKARSPEYLKAAKAAMNIGSNAFALALYRRVHTNTPPPSDAFNMGIVSVRVAEYRDALTYFNAVRERPPSSPVWYYEDIARLMLGMASAGGKSAYTPYCTAIRSFLSGDYSNAGIQYERSLREPLPAAWHAETLRMLDILSDRGMDDAALKRYAPYLRASVSENAPGRAAALLSLMTADAVPERIRLMAAANDMTTGTAALRGALARITPNGTQAVQARIYLIAVMDALLGNDKAARDGCTAYLIEAPDGLFSFEARNALLGMKKDMP